MTGNQGVLNIDQGCIITYFPPFSSCEYSFWTGANAPSWLALLPHDTKDIKGAYVWHDKTIVDWINGPLPNWMEDEKDLCLNKTARKTASATWLMEPEDNDLTT